MSRLAIDIGGTFTDLVFFNEEKKSLVAFKTLSTPSDPSKGVMNATKKSSISYSDVEFFVHGGTTVINTITERKGAFTALITTKGFRDVLEIMRANRPDMYNLKVKKPIPFVPRQLRFEIKERVSYEGELLDELDLSELDKIIEKCRILGVEAIAVQFMHSYLHPEHERECKAYIEKYLPNVPISISSETSREWREYERANTAVLNAYVQPIVQKYFLNLENELKLAGLSCSFTAMQSNGGITSFEKAMKLPISIIESGPAAGVKGAALIGKMIDKKNVIYFDVGGTTTKCSLIENSQPKITTDYRIEWDRFNAGYPIKVPVIDIVEIGAGGGSIAWVDQGGVLRVGPQSAGADPGPACYGRGGNSPTITDAKLLNGVLNPSFFASNQFNLDVELAKNAMTELSTKLKMSLAETASSIIRIAEANMINALKLVSIQKGYDPRDFVLVAGGGGGPMHASYVGNELGVSEIIIPTLPGYFSAWGMLSTDLRVDLTSTSLTAVKKNSLKEIETIFIQLEKEAYEYFASFGTDNSVSLTFERNLSMRYEDQEHTVNVTLENVKPSISQIIDKFKREHKKNFTFTLEDASVEIVTFRLSAIKKSGHGGVSTEGLTDQIISRSLIPLCKRKVTFGEQGTFQTPVYRRSDLSENTKLNGPLIIEEASTVTKVLPSQRLTIDKFGFLRIQNAS